MNAALPRLSTTRALRGRQVTGNGEAPTTTGTSEEYDDSWNVEHDGNDPAQFDGVRPVPVACDAGCSPQSCRRDYARGGCWDG